jgi:hypothetical protein
MNLLVKSLFMVALVRAKELDTKVYFDLGNPATYLTQKAPYDPVKYYNILAIDGGGIRGLLSAQVTDYMEKELYRYAESKNYITNRTHAKGIEKKRLHLSKFFQMLSGTSIGGILTAGFAMPEKKGSKEPKYYSDDITDIGVKMADFSFYETETVKMFHKWLLWVLMAVGALIGAGISYL